MKELIADKLKVNVYGTRAEMGKGASDDIALCINELLKTKNEINMIFAAAPSQNEVLASLCENGTIDWTKINAYHMDEYVGLPVGAPQAFSNFLKVAIFDKVPFNSVNLIDPTATDPKAESERYAKLLEENPADIVVMGIGENGHIAFNDPHVADFNDSSLVKVVDLDDVCRMQQVHDGCFEKLDDVPKYALTLTVPALINPAFRFCVVPAPTKAEAVKNTVYGEIGEWCPATVMRKTDGSVMYCDKDAAALLK